MRLTFSYYFCRQAFHCRHIVVILHMLHPLISTLRKMTFSAHVMITMRFAYGILVNILVLAFLRSCSKFICFCSPKSDRFGIFSLLNLNKFIKQGGSTQVRFQPRSGHLLAAASSNVVSVFDVETDRQMHSLQV
jgi:hypothetical protein